jgi:hypothetical protein
VKTLPVNLVVEGLLDEQVLRGLLRQAFGGLEAGICYGRQGRDHLVKNLPKFNQAAAQGGQIFVILADLEQDDCAPGLIKTWLPKGAYRNLAVRIAIRKIESWLLADREAFAAFAGVPLARVPLQPDLDVDPKARVVALARRSRYRNIREGIVPSRGSTSRVGKNYSGQLTQFVLEHWRIDWARRNSPSLDRAVIALQRFLHSPR